MGNIQKCGNNTSELKWCVIPTGGKPQPYTSLVHAKYHTWMHEKLAQTYHSEVSAGVNILCWLPYFSVADVSPLHPNLNTFSMQSIWCSAKYVYTKRGDIIIVGCWILCIIRYPSDISVGALISAVFSTSCLPKGEG